MCVRVYLGVETAVHLHRKKNFDLSCSKVLSNFETKIFQVLTDVCDVHALA
jgi:hypothetical protein